ncbi:MAG: sarcosine oxidase subunit delta [Pseudomonadota bacterium]
MRITCPYCGARNLEEFTYRGDATVKRPDSLDESATEAWVDYVYLRKNPAGLHKEFWQHTGGCHAWLEVTRDTTTHEIVAVELASKGAEHKER